MKRSLYHVHKRRAAARGGAHNEECTECGGREFHVEKGKLGFWILVESSNCERNKGILMSVCVMMGVISR
jgi:hypothetical protein